MRQDVSSSWRDLRKSSADSNPAARNPRDSISSVVVRRTDASSSTTEIKLFDILNSNLSDIIPGGERNLLGIGISRLAERRMLVSFGLRGFFRRSFDLLDHSYQFGERCSLHLLHRPAALDLYGAFRGSKFSSDLFVEHSRNDHGNHLLLARSQRVKALPKIRHFLVVFAPGAVPIKCHANSIQKLLVTKWLGKKFNRSGFHSTNAHGNFAVAGKENYRDTNVSRRKLSLEIESAQSRKPDIQHKTTGNISRISAKKAIR